MEDDVPLTERTQRTKPVAQAQDEETTPTNERVHDEDTEDDSMGDINQIQTNLTTPGGQTTPGGPTITNEDEHNPAGGEIGGDTKNTQQSTNQTPTGGLQAPPRKKPKKKKKKKKGNYRKK